MAGGSKRNVVTLSEAREMAEASGCKSMVKILPEGKGERCWERRAELTGSQSRGRGMHLEQ